MSAEGFGDFFVTDDEARTPAPAPQPAPSPAPAPVPAMPTPEPAEPEPAPALERPAPAQPAQFQPESVPAPAPVPQAPAPVIAQAPVEVPDAAPLSAAVPAPQPAAPVVTAPTPAAGGAPAPVVSREQQLAAALDHLMAESLEIEASALVSLDGFTMASALPETMQEDRVGAMSAAILGLGERAAAELGRGKLSQVFIEGEDGFVLLMAAGDGAVLTCLAAPEAKLGLVIYDMRAAADRISEILA